MSPDGPLEAILSLILRKCCNLETTEIPDESDLPSKKYIVVHPDDLRHELLRITLEELAMHPKRNYVVYKSVAPWARAGKITFTDKIPSVGDLLFGKVNPGDLKPTPIQTEILKEDCN